LTRLLAYGSNGNGPHPHRQHCQAPSVPEILPSPTPPKVLALFAIEPKLTDLYVVVDADLSNPDHADAIVGQLDAYARDPVANGCGLSDSVKEDLVPGLRDHPGTRVFLAYRGARPVGVAVCFLGFSTFAARRLLNLHDLAVEPGERGAGVGGLLLARVEERARDLGCCKITLEVQENNARALKLYTRFGFHAYELASEAGRALFWQKRLV
jgi:ribosomal protein S18 acetylase RimI-like enzyme